MLPARTATCPTDLALEEHLLVADLRIAAHAASCPRCRAWLAAAASAGAYFDKQVAPAQLPRLRRALVEPLPSRAFPGRLLVAIGATATLAGVALAVMLSPAQRAPSILAKGSGLTVFVRHGGEVHAVSSGEAVSPGDALRFSLAPPGPRQAWVLSVDASGQVSRLAPAQGGPLPVLGPAMLPGSAVLDGGDGPERIFAVLSTRPLPWKAVEDAARRAVAGGGEARVRNLDRLPLPGTEQSTILLERRR